VIHNNIKANITAATPFLPFLNYKLTGNRYNTDDGSRPLQQTITRVLIHGKFPEKKLYDMPNVTHVIIARGDVIDHYLPRQEKYKLREYFSGHHTNPHTKAFINAPYISMFPNAVSVTLQHVYVESLEFMTKLEELILVDTLIGTFDSNIPACTDEMLKPEAFDHHNIKDCYIHITNHTKNKYFRSLKHLKIKLNNDIPITIDMSIFTSLVSLYVYSYRKINIQNIQACESLKSLFVSNSSNIDLISLLPEVSHIDTVSLIVELDERVFTNITPIRCKSMELVLRGNISTSSVDKLATINKIQFQMRSPRESGYKLLDDEMSIEYLNAMYPDGCGWQCVSVLDSTYNRFGLYFTRSTMMKNVRYLKLVYRMITADMWQYVPNLIGLSMLCYTKGDTFNIPPTVKYFEVSRSNLIKTITGTENLECMCILDDYLSLILRSNRKDSKSNRKLKYDFRNLRVLLLNNKRLQVYEKFLIALSIDIQNGLIPLRYLYISQYSESWAIISQLRNDQHVLVNYPISPLPHLFSVYKDNYNRMGARSYRFDIFDTINDRDSTNSIECTGQEVEYH
jgi:hypothetical protein